MTFSRLGLVLQIVLWSCMAVCW